MSDKGLLSWGKFPRSPQNPAHCYWSNALLTLAAEYQKSNATTLAFGAGRSYGDICLAASNQVVYMRPLDRFIAVDWKNGVVRADAGVTLDEVLSIAVPRGWFLTVTPGTRFVTLGGALANDVHGKNHHRRGTFGCHVRAFGLVRSDEGAIECSSTQHSTLFAATIGGLGLTGIISWVEIQLIPIASSNIIRVTKRFDTLAEFFTLSNQYDSQYEFCVSWIDCTAKGRRKGRGIYVAGEFAQDGELISHSRRKLNLPFTPPLSLVNRPFLEIFNRLYWHKAPSRMQQSITHYEPFFYPLDAIQNWNRIYGKQGFQQYQALIPPQNAEAAIDAMLTVVKRHATGSFLAVLKRCGELSSPGVLSFPCAGTTLALDFPYQKNVLSQLFAGLDAIVREAQGRLYPAKDAHMSAADFQRFYPQWSVIEKLRDPILMSQFWQRVTQ